MPPPQGAADPQSALVPRNVQSLKKSTGEITTPQYRQQSTRDMADCYVRTNSMGEFLGELLPFPTNHPDFQRPTYDGNPFQDLENAERMLEANVADIFVRIVNDKERKIMPGLVMRLCQNWPDPKIIDETGQKIDAGLFREDDAPDNGCPLWADQVSSGEFKHRHHGKPTNDAFGDAPNAMEPTAKLRMKARGQITNYSELCHAVQQRVCSFMMFIIGRRFRLIRWDRAGAIVSPCVDYFLNPDPLLDFLWRIAHLTNTPLGFDPSASRIQPGSSNWLLMDKVAKDTTCDFSHEERVLEDDEVVPKKFTWTYVRELFLESISDSAWPRYNLHVKANSDLPTRDYLVGKPVYRAAGMRGRGTRGYAAYDVRDRRFVWLKDVWRVDYNLVEKEGDILERLNRGGICNVPTLVCHGDVRKQFTKTGEWWEFKHPLPAVGVPTGEPTPAFRLDCPVRRHRHYRLVVEEVCLPLSSFRNGKQLVRLILDCLNAHDQASTTSAVQILHRDISDQNILIYPKIAQDKQGRLCVQSQGILADWEMSKSIPAMSNEHSIARQPARSGTWQFASVNLLSSCPRPLGVSDELESLTLVLIYYAVRYLQSDIPTGHAVAEFLDQCFDCYSVDHCAKEILCGVRKYLIIKRDGKLNRYSPEERAEVQIRFGSPMDLLIGELLKRFQCHYQVIEYEGWLHKHPTVAQPLDRFQTPSPSVAGPSSESQTPSPRSAAMDTLYSEGSNDYGAEPYETITLPSTQETRVSAEQVSRHLPMVTELVQASKSKAWKRKDRHPAGDRVPKDYTSKHNPIPSFYEVEE